MEPPLQGRHGSLLRAVGVDLVPRELAAARVDVDVGNLDPALALPDVAADVEEDDDGQRQVLLEEALGVVDAAGSRGDGGEELERSIVSI